MAITQLFSGLFKGFFKVGGKLLGGWLNFSLFALFIGIVFLGATIHSFQQGSFTPLVDEIGGRFFNVLNNLNIESLKIIEQGGAIDGFFGTIKNYWNFLLNIYVLYFEIWVLAKLVAFSPFSDGSRFFVNYTLAIIIFFIFQEFYILYYDIGEPNLPLDSLKNTFKAGGYLFEPIQTFANVIVEKPEEIINGSLVNETLDVAKEIFDDAPVQIY